MTIRQHYHQLFKRVTWVVVAVAMVLGAVITWGYPNLTRAQNRLAYAVVAVVMGGLLVLVFKRRFLCPRCGADLSKLYSEELSRKSFVLRFIIHDRRQFWDDWNACPKCGVSFDDEWGPIS